MIEFAAAIAFCLLMEGLFTGAEMVLVCADPHKLTERARRGERGAQIALDLLSRPEQAISTTLTGTNLFVVLSTIIATSHFLPGFGDRAELLAVAAVTPLVILFGEIVPKSFVQPRADALAGGAARFVRYAGIALYPFVAAASFFARLLSSPFGGVPPIRGMVTREELRLILQTSRAGSDVEPHERVMVRRAFRFGEKKVADIFRPLAQVVALPEDAVCREAAQLASRSGYSRYPVYKDRIDRVVGYVHIFDLVGSSPDAPVLPLLRKALFVPELMPIDELMRNFQSEKTSFAVAVDEFGGVTGVLTAEDVVEEIVGEIEDEYDRGTEYHKKISPVEFLVRGSMEIRRFEEEIGVPLPAGDYSTVGGMLISLAEKIPAVGDTFAVPGAEFTVVHSSDRAIKEIRVHLKTEREGEEALEKIGEKQAAEPGKDKE
ncbi:MAG: HlyC/CorC family transporter [Deltaproteobacteria bacterium]|nr:HlyC/CorC family transporter [Deltaproteobacteria bacterium]